MGKRPQHVKQQHQRHWGRWLIGIFSVVVLVGLIGLMMVQVLDFSAPETSSGQSNQTDPAQQHQTSRQQPTSQDHSHAAESSGHQAHGSKSSSTAAASSSSSSASTGRSSSSQSATGVVPDAAAGSSANADGATSTPRANDADPTPQAPTNVTPAPGQNHLAAASQYAFDVQQVRAQMYGQGSAIGQKTVFLTFDDGINPTITPQILAILHRYQVHATFFLVGKAINQSTRALLLQEYQSGHGIAIHSFDHNYSRLYPKRRANATQILAEAEQTQAALRQYLGQQFRTRVWRYPGGHMSWQNLAPADLALRQHGYYWMDWNAASGDALGAKEAPKTVAQMVQYQAYSLSYFPDHGVRVVLMHDAAGKQLTVAALPQIIEFYQQRGYRFGILS